jgi:hypothetical protein
MDEVLEPMYCDFPKSLARQAFAASCRNPFNRSIQSQKSARTVMWRRVFPWCGQAARDDVNQCGKSPAGARLHGMEFALNRYVECSQY